jgi:hypothetical protein
MAGIYGDIVFHLGSAGRGNVFRQDFNHSSLHRASAPIERVRTVGPRSQALQRALLRFARRDVEERVITRNRETFHLLREQLVLDPDALIGYLEGSEPAGASLELASIDSRDLKR